MSQVVAGRGKVAVDVVEDVRQRVSNRQRDIAVEGLGSKPESESIHADHVGE